MGIYNEAINQNIDNLQVNTRLGNGGGESTKFTSEILYTNSGTGKDDITLSKPYTDFYYLDITFVKYDDNTYFDFIHTQIDCSQIDEIINNTLLSGRTNCLFYSVTAGSSTLIHYKFTDSQHISYLASLGNMSIYQIKGIKF